MQLYDVLKHFVNLTQASFRVSRMTKSEHPPLTRVTNCRCDKNRCTSLNLKFNNPVFRRDKNQSTPSPLNSRDKNMGTPLTSVTKIRSPPKVQK